MKWKNNNKISSFIFACILILMNSFAFGQEKEAPNILIIDNPYKEVKTVQADKNRDHGQMDISVNKINITDIQGIAILKDIIAYIPKDNEESTDSNDNYLIVNSLDDLDQLDSNIRRKKRNIALNKLTLMTTDEKNNIVKIENGSNKQNNFIIKLNNNSNEIKKVYKVNSLSNNLYNEKNLSYAFSGVLIAKKGEILDYTSSEVINLGGAQIDSNRTLFQSNGTIKFSNDEYFNTISKIDKNIASVYFSQLQLDISSNPFINLEEIIKASKLNKHKEEKDVYHGKILINFQGGSISGNYGSVFKVINLRPGLYFEPTSEQILGKYELTGLFSIHTNISRNYSIEVQRPLSLITNVQIKDIVPLGKELSLENSISNELIITNNPIAKDLSYVKKNSNKRIELIGVNGTIVKDISNGGTTRIIEAEKGGAKLKIEYKQTQNQGAKPFITKLQEANSKQIFNIQVKMLSEDMVNSLNGTGDMLNITVEPKQSIPIGEVMFKFDARLAQLKKDSWIKANGDVSINFTNNSINYAKLMTTEGNFTLDKIINIQEVKSVNGITTSIEKNYNGIIYKIFVDNNGQKIAIPLNKKISELKNSIMLSNSNLAINDINFVVKGNDNLLYDGTIKKAYTGESAVIGTGTLDLTILKFKENSWFSWNKSTIGKIGNIQNTSAGISTNKVSMNIASGKLFNWESSLSSNQYIVTKLKVTNNGTIKEGNNTGERTEIDMGANKIGIDAEGFFIHKKEFKLNDISYKIEVYHHDILLGTLNLTVKNSKPFTIIGDNKIDFGHFFPGDVRQEEGLFEFENYEEAKVIVTLGTTDPKMTKIGHIPSPDRTIPITSVLLRDIKYGTYGGKNTTTFKLSAAAKTTKNTEVGKYQGQLEVVITVIP